MNILKHIIENEKESIFANLYIFSHSNSTFGDIESTLIKNNISQGLEKETTKLLFDPMFKTIDANNEYPMLYRYDRK